jgi:exonuclease III
VDHLKDLTKTQGDLTGPGEIDTPATRTERKGAPATIRGGTQNVQQLGTRKTTKVNAVAYLMTVYNLDYLALTETGLALTDLNSIEHTFRKKGMHFYGSADATSQASGSGTGQGVAFVLSNRFFLETVGRGGRPPATVDPGRIMSMRLRSKAASEHTIFAVYGKADPNKPDSNAKARTIATQLQQSVKDALKAGSTVTVAGDLNIPLREKDFGTRDPVNYETPTGLTDIASALNDMGLTDLHHKIHPATWQPTVFASECKDQPEKETTVAKLDYILGCQGTATATTAATTDAYFARELNQWDHALLLTEFTRDALLGTPAPKPHPIPYPRVSASRHVDEASEQWKHYAELCSQPKGGWNDIHSGELKPGNSVTVEGFTGLDAQWGMMDTYIERLAHDTTEVFGKKAKVYSDEAPEKARARKVSPEEKHWAEREHLARVFNGSLRLKKGKNRAKARLAKGNKLLRLLKSGPPAEGAFSTGFRKESQQAQARVCTLVEAYVQNKKSPAESVKALQESLQRYIGTAGKAARKVVERITNDTNDINHAKASGTFHQRIRGTQQVRAHHMSTQIRRLQDDPNDKQESDFSEDGGLVYEGVDVANDDLYRVVWTSTTSPEAVKNNITTRWTPLYRGDNSPQTESVEYKRVFKLSTKVKPEVKAALEAADMQKPATIEELTEALKAPKTGSALGADRLGYAFFKYAQGPKESLLKVINACLVKGDIPAVWKSARVLLLPKDPEKPDDSVTNHRPISLMSCGLKTLERIIKRRWVEQIEKYDLLQWAQFGSRPARQTQQPLHLLLDIIEDSNRNGDPKHLAMLDWKTAFDSVPFQCVADGLRRIGWPQKSIDFYEKTMEGRTASFITGYGDTAPIDIKSSVIQGSVLGPLLYLIAMDGLLEELNGMPGVQIPRVKTGKDFGRLGALQYVDDTILLASSKEELEEMVAKVIAVATAMGMALNRTKTVYTVTGDRDTEHGPLSMGTDYSPTPQTPADKAFRYLGVHIQADGGWTAQEKILEEKIDGYLARMAAISLRDNQVKTAIEAVVMPTLLYAGSIACLSDAWVQKMDTKITRTAKASLRLRSGTATAYLRGPGFGLGIPSLREALDNEIIASAYLRLNQVDTHPEGSSAWARLSDTLQELGATEEAMTSLSFKEWDNEKSHWRRQVWSPRTKSRAEQFLRALGRQGWSAKRKPSTPTLVTDLGQVTAAEHGCFAKSLARRDTKLPDEAFDEMGRARGQGPKGAGHALDREDQQGHRSDKPTIKHGRRPRPGQAHALKVGDCVMWSAATTGEPYYAKVTDLFGASSTETEAVMEPEGAEEEPDTQYEVDKILNSRQQDGEKKEYLVSWKGYGPEDDTWEPLDGLVQTAGQALERYNKRPCKAGNLPTWQQHDETVDTDREGAIVQVQWLTKHICEADEDDENGGGRGKMKEAFYSPALEAMACNAKYHEADARQQTGVVQVCNAIFNANVRDLYPVPTRDKRATNLEATGVTPVDTAETPGRGEEEERWQRLQVERIAANDEDSTITGELILTAEEVGVDSGNAFGVRPTICRTMKIIGKSLEAGIDVWEAARRARGKRGYLKAEARGIQPDHESQVTTKELEDYIYDPRLSHAAPTALLQYAAALLAAAEEQNKRNIKSTRRRPTDAPKVPRLGDGMHSRLENHTTWRTDSHK